MSDPTNPNSGDVTPPPFSTPAIGGQIGQPVVPPSNGTAGFVLGLLATIFGAIPCTWWLGIILGIIGTPLSISGRKKAEATGGNVGRAKAGLILSVIGIVVGLLWLVLVLAFGEVDFNTGS